MRENLGLGARSAVETMQLSWRRNAQRVLESVECLPKRRELSLG